jgi:hypothetical protein
MSQPPFSLKRCIDEARIDQVNRICARRSDAMFAAIAAREAAMQPAGKVQSRRLVSRIKSWLRSAA